MLSGAFNELALSVLREGITAPRPDRAPGGDRARPGPARSGGRRHGGGRRLQQAEATRLAAQEAAAEKQWSAADGAADEADEIVRAVTTDRRAVEAHLAQGQGRARASGTRDRAARRCGPARDAEVAHESAGLAAEQAALEARLASFEAQIADLRGQAVGARSAAAARQEALDQAVAARRQAASAMAASIAGRQRDRAEAEREVADLTGQLGRAAAQARPPHTSLLSTYQNIDRLSEMIGERSAQLALLVEANARYDQRKLITGVGLVTTMLLASAAAALGRPQVGGRRIGAASRASKAQAASRQSPPMGVTAPSWVTPVMASR